MLIVGKCNRLVNNFNANSIEGFFWILVPAKRKIPIRALLYIGLAKGKWDYRRLTFYLFAHCTNIWAQICRYLTLTLGL